MSISSGIQNTISSALGSISSPGAFGTNLQSNPANTTTAVNIALVVNGIAQGLIKSFRLEESFDQHGVKVIGSAVNTANIPGVYTASISLSKVFINGLDLNSSFGGNVRPVTGKVQTSADFTQFYFDIVVLDLKGNPVQIFHDCVVNSVSTSVEIDSVIIMEEAQCLVRWSEKN